MLSDKAKQLFCAAAKGDGLEIEFYVARSMGGSSYSIIVGREFNSGPISHREYLEFVEAANELVTQGLVSNLYAGGDREYVFQLTLEGYRKADSNSE